jgi:hypothetical protein
MAQAKPAYTSSGVHQGSSNKIRNSMRADYRNSSDRMANQLHAFRQGKNTVVTIENPNKEETNKKFIKVPGSHIFKQIFDSSKEKQT